MFTVPTKNPMMKALFNTNMVKIVYSEVFQNSGKYIVNNNIKSSAAQINLKRSYLIINVHGNGDTQKKLGPQNESLLTWSPLPFNTHGPICRYLTMVVCTVRKFVLFFKLTVMT